MYPRQKPIENYLSDGSSGGHLFSSFGWLGKAPSARIEFQRQRNLSKTMFQAGVPEAMRFLVLAGLEKPCGQGQAPEAKEPIENDFSDGSSGGHSFLSSGWLGKALWPGSSSRGKEAHRKRFFKQEFWRPLVF